MARKTTTVTKKPETAKTVTAPAKTPADGKAPAAKAPAAKAPATKAPAKKVAEAKAPAKKAAETKTTVAAKKPAARKTTKKEMKVSTFVEYYGKQVEEKDIVASVKKAWTRSGKKVGDIKTMSLYIKPEEGAVYYVINETESGAVAF